LVVLEIVFNLCEFNAKWQLKKKNDKKIYKKYFFGLKNGHFVENKTYFKNLYLIGE
jgi:hypothetical protein